MNDNDFERVKKAVSLKDYAAAHLKPAAGGKFVCPYCNSGGSGKADSDSALSVRGETFLCFSCQRRGNVFTLAGAIHGTDNKHDQLLHVARWAHMEITDKKPDGSQGDTSSQGQRDDSAEPDYSQGREAEAAKVKAAQETIKTSEATDAVVYLIERGFAPDEITTFGFGARKATVENKDGWKDGAGKWVNGWRVVIPWRGFEWYHADRACSSDVSKLKYLYPKTEDVGGKPVENLAALESDTVFIVEGALDGLAIQAAGYASMVAGGTAYEGVLQVAAARDYKGVLVLMYDSDEPGQGAQGRAAAMADSLGLRHYEADFKALTGCKDACEMLEKDRDGLKAALAAIVKAAKGLEQAEIMKTLGLQNPMAIAGEIYACEGYEEPIKTGIKSLDDVTNGGLRSGLVVLGATSSAGKTTLCVQVADYMAAHGVPVLFVTIEQSGRELVSKSLSRLMAQRGYEGVPVWAMNSLTESGKWTEEKAVAFAESCNDYTSTVAGNLFYLSANEQPTVKQVEAAAHYVKSIHGASPVVFIDYLQLLAPRDERDTDKRAADYNVSQLRRMARDMKAPVVTISSLNRTSYSGSIEMESFKESGGIEYGADILLGLQPFNMEARIGDAKGEDARKKRAKDVTNEFKREKVRKCEIVVLKNRNGALPKEPLPVTFDCASSLFTDGVETGAASWGIGNAPTA